MPTALASMKCRSGTAPITVLVLDASAALGLSIIRSLRRYGVNAMLATSGAQALQNCKLNEVGAVVFHDDARGGRHHLADLQRVYPRLPLAMVGSDHGKSATERGSELSTERVAYFAKPLEITELLERLNVWIKPHVEPAAEQREGWEPPTSGLEGHATSELVAAEEPVAIDDPGNAPTQQMPKVGDAPSPQPKPKPKTAEFHSATLARVTGSYSIVNRRRDTLQFAAV